MPRVPMQIDVVFGDTVVPDAAFADYAMTQWIRWPRQLDSGLWFRLIWPGEGF